MEPITLYAYKFRSRAERVLWTLKELELPHTVVRIDPTKGENLAPDFVKLNSSAKAPALVHGDHVLTESLAIMEYLNSISTIKLIPTSALERYTYNHRIFYGVTEIEPYLWIADQDLRLKQRYTWPAGTAEESIARVKKAVPVIFDMLNSYDYVAGNTFTLADIYYFQIFTWASKYDVTLPEHVNIYLHKLSARPHFPAEMTTPS